MVLHSNFSKKDFVDYQSSVILPLTEAYSLRIIIIIFFFSKFIGLDVLF
jgi:hypothetical protein